MTIPMLIHAKTALLFSVTSLCAIGELHFVPVLSTRAHARLMSVDPGEALDLPGVKTYVDHKDVPGDKIVGILEKRKGKG